MSLSMCKCESRVAGHILLFPLLSLHLHLDRSPLSFLLNMCATAVCACISVCLRGGCVHVEVYHNKQSKYPMGIDTFSLPPSPSGTSEI